MLGLALCGGWYNLPGQVTLSCTAGVSMNLWHHFPAEFWYIFLVSVVCQYLAVILQFRLLREANKLLPKDKQLSYYFGYPGVYQRQMKKHKEFYPNSHLRRYIGICNILTIFFAIIAFIVSGFFSPDFFDSN